MNWKVGQRFVGLNFNVHQHVFIISGGLLAPLESRVHSIRAGKLSFPSWLHHQKHTLNLTLSKSCTGHRRRPTMEASILVFLLTTGTVYSVV